MEKNGVEVITFGDKKCLNEKHIETQLELSNLVAFTKKYSFKLRKKSKNYKILAIINVVEGF